MAISNYRRFFAILKYMPPLDSRDEQKRQLVLQYTDNRTDSLQKMTEKEYNKMCNDLGRRYGTDEAYRKLKSGCLRLMQRRGTDTTDWDEVDRFCLKPQVSGKRFREHSYDELVKLTRKLHAMIASDKKKAESKLTNN